MTLQQLIDYWGNEVKKLEYELNPPITSNFSIDLKRIHELNVLIVQARIIYMQLCTIDTTEPAIETSTSFYPPCPKCGSRILINGETHYKCFKCSFRWDKNLYDCSVSGISPNDNVINSSST